MIYLSVQPEGAILLSIVKPVLFALLLGGWAWLATYIDKDAEYFHLRRHLWNGILIGCAFLGLGMLLLVPFFFIGLPLGLLILAGGFLGYAYYRNQHVPPTAKWTFSLQSLRERAKRREQNQALKRANITLLNKDDSPKPMPTDSARVINGDVCGLQRGGLKCCKRSSQSSDRQPSAPASQCGVCKVLATVSVPTAINLTLPPLGLLQLVSIAPARLPAFVDRLNAHRQRAPPC